MSDAPHDRADRTHRTDRTERGARRVGAGIIVSRAAGFVRNAVVGMVFGDGAQADAYTAATRIPNVLRNLLGEGAIGASFVPVYAAALERGDERGARALANALLGVLLVGISLLTLIGIAIAPILTDLLLSSFDAEKAALTTKLMRVLFPMTGLMVLSGWCLAVQNAHRRFFFAYASAAVWSIPQIVLLIVAEARTDDLTQIVWWLSWATLVGAVMQIATQLPQVLSLLGRVRPTLQIASPGVRDTLSNFLPVVLALGVFQVSGFVDLWIAGGLTEGSVANLNYASQLYMLPLSLFGVAGAVAALPELAREQARGNMAALQAGIVRSWERVLFYTIPSAVAFITIGDVIVGFTYRGARFGADEQRIVYFVLIGYAIGLVGYALARILAAAFQAIQDYRTPFRAACMAIVASAAGALSLSLPFRSSSIAVAGIAAGSAIGAYVNLALLWRTLPARVGALDMAGPRHVLRGALVSSIAAGVATVPFRLVMTSFPVRLQAAVMIPVFCAAFLATARWRGLAEADRVVAVFRGWVARVQ